jgi:D-xylonolactonase
MSAPAPRVLVDRAFRLAENPVWDGERNRVLWTDIEAGEVFAMDWGGGGAGAVERLYHGPKVGGFTLQRDGSVLLFRERDVAVLDARGGVRTVLDAPNDKATRFNDCMALPSGAVIAGTISHPRTDAGLHSLSVDGMFVHVAAETGISNGLSLSPPPDHRWVYWTCSTTNRIYRYAFDARTDALGARTILHQAPEGTGTPDGLTVDAAGRLYSARWGGSMVAVIDPESGAILQRIAVPGKHATSCVFAGPELDVLVVTIAEGPIVAVEGVGRGLAEFRSGILTPSASRTAP